MHFSFTSMKKQFSFLLLVLFSFQFTFAQSDNSVLWEIKGNGLKQSSYLLGYLPQNNQRALMLPEVTEEKMQQAEIVAIAPYTSVEGMSSDKSLEELFSKEDYKKLETLADQKFGMFEWRIFKSAHPAYLANQLFSAGTYLNLLTQPVNELKKKAQESGKEIIFPEGEDQRKEAYEKISQGEQVALLSELINNHETWDKTYDEMLAAYERQDMTKLKQLLSKTEKYPQYWQQMVTERNKNIVTSLETTLKKNLPLPLSLL